MIRSVNATGHASASVRIFDPIPAHGLVLEREKMIMEFRSRLLKRRNVPELITTLAGLCNLFDNPATIPRAVAVQVEAAFRKVDGSFSRCGRNLEVGVCGIVAVNQAIISGEVTGSWKGWSVPDVLAGCVWAGLSFLPNRKEKKLDLLRRSVLSTARQRFCASGSAARVRYDVRAATELRRQSANRDAHTLALDLIRRLQINALLDREEIAILRWMLKRRSISQDTPREVRLAVSRVIAAGLEIGTLAQAPPTQFQQDQLLREVSENIPFSLAELLEALGDDRLAIGRSLGDKSVLRQASLVFPTLSAICSGDVTGPGASGARPLSEWVYRVLLERILLGIKL